MAEVIAMPRLSDTMTEGVIAKWHKKVGDTVKKGDVLAEIETDKATMDLDSYNEGVLLHIGGADGSKIQVDDLLAIIGSAGEDISALLSAPAKSSPAATEVATIAQPTAAAPAALDLSTFEEVVLMPRLSDTMTEGVIASWQKKVGDKVAKGEVLAEIETDKATMDLDSYKDGILLYQGAEAGVKVQVNDLLAIIGDASFDIKPILAAAKSGGGQQQIQAVAPIETSVPAATITAKAAEPAIVNAGRILASPLAKKLAAEKGIDLRFVKGSADNGRIVKTDIEAYVPVSASSTLATAPSAQLQKELPATHAVAPFVPNAAGEGFTDNTNSQMRKVIAKRLSESKFSAPHFYLKMEVNMDNAMAARLQMNEVSASKISFNDLIIKAAAMALRKHPAVNSSWMGDFIRTYQHIHIGVAVAIPDGLIVPVIRFADQKSLAQIAAEAKELGGKAKNKKLQPHEFTGNTFTISNLGMMDIDEFTAIVNPPDSCILAVGKIKEEVYRNAKGEFAVKNIMKLTLSCDHRSVDGSVGAAFLQTLKAFLENPVTMLV